eukprot:CAMPEP_0196570930 /NCGR_PEP_ID=MMETSP1081-20130531/1090_1 /TAXON_ID=36882 /ORGANISM="Pyramimonas amylifera, Strain CCMP720" /LENGTH=218 /DNA_ID=CAMNT_0041887633 /DNA_START=56 /DNA_END=712 /DNA_ORIENTATION=+
MLRQAASSISRDLIKTPVIARGFATAEKTPLIHPPVRQFGLAARYCAALYSCATKKQILPTVDAEVKQVAEMAKTNAKFSSFLANPSINKKKKEEFIMAFLKELKFSETTQNLFGVMASNGRLKQTGQVAKLFQEIMMAHRGEVPARVTSAEPLTAEQLASVTTQCKSYLEEGKTLVLEQKVNPAIIGGLIIDVGDKHIDLSIDTKIRKMEAILREPL